MPLMPKIKKTLAKYYFKIVREKASPEYIARGWAIGMFYGCFIPFGLQLVLSIPTSFLLKGSKIGATLGTLLTNPVSIWFIYPVQCYAGSILIGGGLEYDRITQAVSQILQPAENWYDPYMVLFSLGWRLAVSFFIGGALLTAVTTPLTYFGVKKMVVQYRKKVEERRKRKEAKAGQPKTEQAS